MIEKKVQKKVFVAMSGGVDSSVAAALLKEQGLDVVGVTMCFNIPQPRSKRPSCCGVDGIEDAKRAADTLKIPHYVLNYGETLQEEIIKNFIEEYISGRTPNPCVCCNQAIKFGRLYEEVKQLGGDFIATGHYARITSDESTKKFQLKKGIDSVKDQSYFLYGIKKDILPEILFPLGDWVKDDVRKKAKECGLKNADKQGSQDICFVSKDGYQSFLKERVGHEVIQPGPVKDQDGKTVGEHQGIAFYTIGQRDGLGVALGRPVYIYKIERETNTIYLGDENRLLASSLVACRVNFLTDDTDFKGKKIKAKIRYNQSLVEALIEEINGDQVKVVFDEPQKAVTPGQSVVFYEGDVVLGGGIIRSEGSK